MWEKSLIVWQTDKINLFLLNFVFLSRFESIRAGFATAKGDLRLGWISKTKTVITNGKFLALLPRRFMTLQLPKQIVSTLWFNQALLFLPKRSAKTACARADEDCPTFIQAGLCSRRSVVSVYWAL